MNDDKFDLHSIDADYVSQALQHKNFTIGSQSIAISENSIRLTLSEDQLEHLRKLANKAPSQSPRIIERSASSLEETLSQGAGTSL